MSKSQSVRLAFADANLFAIAESVADTGYRGRYTNPHAESQSDLDAFPHSDAYAESGGNTNIHSDTDRFAQPNTDANLDARPDRRRFQRGVDQRSGQAALQPDDHQPRARQRAARRQRAGQLQ